MSQNIQTASWQEIPNLESFEEILFHLSEMRDALFQVFRAVDSDPLSGRKSARQLGLDRNLAWRVSKFVGTSDLMAAVPDVPSSKQIDRICDACEKHGAPDELLKRVQTTNREYAKFVEEAAGNREYFEALVSGLVIDDVSGRQEGIRRDAFFANVAQWGVQAKLDFKTVVYSPNPSNPDLVEIMRLGGRVDFKRSRQIAWPLHRAHWYSDDGAVQTVELEPISPTCSQKTEDLALIEEFCSKPIPQLIQVKTSFGRRVDLPDTGFGNAGALTTVFGDINRAASNIRENCRWRAPGMDYHASMNDLYTPTERVVHDVFLHRDLKDFGQPEVMLLDRLSASRGYNPTIDEHSRLPLSTRAIRISARSGGTSIPEYSEYPELLKFAFDSVRWNAEDFYGYRFMLKFPTVPSATVVRFTLSDKPE